MAAALEKSSGGLVVGILFLDAPLTAGNFKSSLGLPISSVCWLKVEGA
jgi:DNA-binding transcriptional regulator GbsR (MarR family)